MSTIDGGHYQHTLSTVRAARPDAYLQIVFRLEETNGVEIDTAAFDQVKKIDDIVDYLCDQIVGDDDLSSTSQTNG